MKDSVRWSVVVVVPKGNLFLALAKDFNPRDVNFPGGDSDVGDLSAADTAVRELYEETGLRVEPGDLRRMDGWLGERGQPVHAFFATKTRGRPRSSSEGKAFWTAQLALFTAKTSQHHLYNRRLLQKLMRVAA